jgi:V8-like Glu-specific endopeptidase
MHRSEEVVKEEISREDLQKYPYRAIGNIAAKYEISPGIWLICRGVAFLIHEKVILTCGHNCFLK